MPASSGRGPRSRTDDPSGDGGPDEAAALIAENLVDLARLARRHGRLEGRRPGPLTLRGSLRSRLGMTD